PILPPSIQPNHHTTFSFTLSKALNPFFHSLHGIDKGTYLAQSLCFPLLRIHALSFLRFYKFTESRQ
ncbi:hypothetical protein, partial [Bartonella henselae]|uniref:hypothetical protein n=1 Tax=Bartonella henselae TaxID=38323 RepID=UPI00249DAE2F